MYRNFYQLNYAPFATTDHPEPLFLSPRHQTALESIVTGIEQQQGLAVLTGEAGIGKTTLLRSMLTSLPTLQPYFISDSDLSLGHRVSPKELIRSMKRKVGQEPAANASRQSLAEMINELQEFFIQANKQGTTVVMVVDDAHLLPLETLRMLPQIIDIFPYRDKLAHLVLLGQPSLTTKLRDPKLQALKSQIATFVTLPRLKKKESQTYIKTKLEQATTANASIVSTPAIKTIANYAQGIPRNLNVLCTETLTTGFQQQKHPIPKRLVREIIAAFDHRSAHRSTRLKWLGAVSTALLLSLVTLALTGQVQAISSAPQTMLARVTPQLKQIAALSGLSNAPAALPAAVAPEPPSTPRAPQDLIPSPAIRPLAHIVQSVPNLLEERPAPLARPASTPVLALLPTPVSSPALVSAPSLPPLTGTLQQVATLIDKSFPNSADIQLQVWANKGIKSTYTEGEKLLVHVRAELNVYLQVDYYQADGQVVHLLPNALDQNQVQAGQVFTLGTPENTFQFEITPPFGVEMLTVVASQTPFAMQTATPTIESADNYLERLTHPLKSTQDQGHMAAAYVHIQTRKEFPTRLSQTVNP